VVNGGIAIPIWTVYGVCSVYMVYATHVVTDGLIVLGDVLIVLGDVY